MRRQIRTGRIFLILLICDNIIASFHPLVQDEVVNTFVELFQPGLFMNTCCNRRCSSERHGARGWEVTRRNHFPLASFPSPPSPRPSPLAWLLCDIATAFMNNPG
jgi:hypothetical protein